MQPYRHSSGFVRGAFGALNEAEEWGASGSRLSIRNTLQGADLAAGAEEASKERREIQSPRVIGHLVCLNGTEGVINCRLETGEEDWSVGHLITIVHRNSRLVGVVCEIATNDGTWSEAGVNTARAKIELSGEIIDDVLGTPVFHRGVRSFPSLGAVAHRIRADDLRAIYSFRGRQGVEIGKLSQNDLIPAEIDVSELIGRHFAVLGSTGVGKTTAVSLLLKRSVAIRPKLRVMIFDPHNEYARHFTDSAQVIDSDSFELPFWMFRFDEFADIVFSGRQPHADERDALYEIIRIARAKYLSDTSTITSTSPLRRHVVVEGASSTPDTPTPFRIIDVVAIIEEWLGKLDQRFSRSDLKALRFRVEGLSRDPRFRFMFGRPVVEDDIAKVISRLFRIPTHSLPITIVPLAGLPSCGASIGCSWSGRGG